MFASSKRLFILAGEASGDLHGANLIKALLLHDPSLKLAGWGGDKMEAAGLALHKHIRDLAFMGFLEVVKNLPTIFANFSLAKKQILAFKPDALVLIDYPGFNLRMAKWAFEQQIPVYYYIAPQVWAWKKGRIKQMKAYIKHLYAILPFETRFFADNGFERVSYVGHPLLDELKNLPNNVQQLQENLGVTENQHVVALLPGSRKQEISTMLPIMLRAAERIPNAVSVIAAAPNIDIAFYNSIIGTKKALIVHNQTYTLLQLAKIAAVTSGTATLETALLGTPQVVCYKGNYISYVIAKKLIKVKYISLVNLIADKEVVKELIQNQLNPQNLANALQLIKDGQQRNECISAYHTLVQNLGGGGASERVALHLLKALNNPN